MQEKGVKKGQKAPRILSRFGFPSFFVLGSFSKKSLIFLDYPGVLPSF
jgi:hypothetical protein